MRSRASDRGFTLIELMVSVSIFAVVSMAAFSVLSAGQKTAVTADQTTAIHTNIRMALDLMARDIRMTGFGSPPAGSISAACPQMLTATDNTVGADTGPDSISITTVDQQMGALGVAFDSTQNNIITLATSLPSDIAIGQVVSLDGATGFTGTIAAFSVATKKLTLVVPNTATPLTIPSGDSRSFSVGTGVVRLYCVVYTVTGGNVTPPYQLVRNGIPMVDGIESIQLAYGVDTDGDGRIDDQAGGLANVVDCLDFVPNNTACKQGIATLVAGTVSTIPSSVNSTPTAVRQVRITVVGRAIAPGAINRANSCWDDETYRPLATTLQVEDQLLAKPVFPVGCPQGAGQPAGIRRRAMTRIVSLRNASNF